MGRRGTLWATHGLDNGSKRHLENMMPKTRPKSGFSEGGLPQLRKAFPQSQNLMIQGMYMAVLVLFGVYPPEGLTRYLTNQDCPDNHFEIHVVPHELPARKEKLIFKVRLCFRESACRMHSSITFATTAHQASARNKVNQKRAERPQWILTAATTRRGACEESVKEAHVSVAPLNQCLSILDDVKPLNHQ